MDAKERYRDWEIDTIIAKDQQGAIVTLTKRKASFSLRLLCSFLQLTKIPYIRLLDNGTEFAAHEYIARKLNTKFYFAHPYSSGERGLNEYTNKLIRQYIIKGTSFDLYTDGYIQLIKNKINRRPRV